MVALTVCLFYEAYITSLNLLEFFSLGGEAISLESIIVHPYLSLLQKVQRKFNKGFSLSPLSLSTPAHFAEAFLLLLVSLNDWHLVIFSIRICLK